LAATLGLVGAIAGLLVGLVVLLATQGPADLVLGLALLAGAASGVALGVWIAANLLTLARIGLAIGLAKIAPGSRTALVLLATRAGIDHRKRLAGITRGPASRGVS